MKARIVAIVLMLGIVAGIWSLRGRAMDHYLSMQAYEDIYYLPPPKWLQVMSLGHRRAVADLIWLRALIYFGDEFVNRGAVKHVFHYGEAMLALDPDFRRVYRWIGVAGVYTPTGSPPEFVERAIDVLRRGVERFPNDGDLAWDAGATLIYELVPNLPRDDPDRERLKAEGNEHMMAAARLGAGPAWLVITNATSLRKLGERDRELHHLDVRGDPRPEGKSPNRDPPHATPRPRILGGVPECQRGVRASSTGRLSVHAVHALFLRRRPDRGSASKTPASV
ncbi:MAG: hypothetical protein JRF54_15040 [Deltaproteobacteria bacterium]|nr:hypothetical protein [Deltaproteobacteria bacterium]